VFYFALSAMLFRFAANLGLEDVWDTRLIGGYLAGTLAVYLIATIVALVRRQDLPTTAVEAQCAAIGNVGFLGIPMLALLLGEQAVGVIMMVIATDLIVFSSLIVILITGSRDGRFHLGILRTIASGLVKNPMILSISTALIWSALEIPIPGPMNDFLTILGAAATPGALFAVGASLASKSAERVSVAVWLSFCKLALHPALVALFVLVIFPVDPYSAAVVISCAALPVAGNVYILAQHYGVAPHRVSASILFSTVISIVTVSAIIATVSPV
jgi:predicted permease